MIYTPDELAAIETEARALFEADPSAKWESGWDWLAPYKRRDWIAMAETARLREEDRD